MTILNWTTDRAEHRLIEEIVDRAEQLNLVERRRKLTLTMDLTACHLNGTPLNLHRLRGFPDFDFVHDIAGISRHLDRDTGKLGDCFAPRCALTEQDIAEATQRVLDTIFRAQGAGE